MNEYRKLEMQERTNTRKEEYKYFVGTTLKNALEYAPGEKIENEKYPDFELYDMRIKAPWSDYVAVAVAIEEASK